MEPGEALAQSLRLAHELARLPQAALRSDRLSAIEQWSLDWQQATLNEFRLGIATVAACGGFAAISGSSVATAATFSAVAYPEMRRFGYPQSFATGVIAAGGTLGAMLPPSTVLAVYGIITEQDIGKLFIAGIIPGLLAMSMYMITIALIGYLAPGFLPQGKPLPWRARFAGLKDIWAPVLSP